MPLLQLGLTILGVFIIPGLIFLISTQIDKRLGALELNLEKRFGQIASMNAEHMKESEVTHVNFERRLTMLESERESIHERFNQIQLNIASALREVAQGAPGEHDRRSHGGAD